MAVDVYGCTVDDVQKLLVWDVKISTHPTAAMVDDWIEEGALELQDEVGLLDEKDTSCGGAGRRLRARRIVALYAAAMAEDAHYPERALDRIAGSYGAQLYDRWEKRFAQLVADIERCREGIDPSGPVGGVAHSFPLWPLIRRCAGT